MTSSKKLLFLSTYGYPQLDCVLRDYHYQVTKVKTLRKALSIIKQLVPDVILAEFVYAPTYGSQLSNFESLFAAAQTFAPDSHFIALVHKEDLHHFESVSASITNCQLLLQPVEPAALAACFESQHD